MPVEVLAGAFVMHGRSWAAWWAAIWTSRRSTPTSSMFVTKVWRSMYGCIHERRTTEAPFSLCNRRVAQCRFMRTLCRLSRGMVATVHSEKGRRWIRNSVQVKAR